MAKNVDILSPHARSHQSSVHRIARLAEMSWAQARGEGLAGRGPSLKHTWLGVTVTDWASVGMCMWVECVRGSLKILKNEWVITVEVAFRAPRHGVR